MSRFVFILFFWVSFISAGQTKFFKLYTDNGDDFGEGIVQLEDSSYMITGSSSSFTNGPSEAFLLKIDSLGNYLWSNHYGGSETEMGRRVMYAPNDGFYVAGMTNSYGAGAYDFYLFKTDLNGSLIWEKTYGGSGWDRVNDALLTSDNGIIMVGENASNITDNKDIYIVKTDLNGDTLWTKTIGGNGEDYASSVIQYNDSLLGIGGTVYVEDSLLQKACLISIHNNGTLQWLDTIGDNGNFWVEDVCFYNDEIFFIGGKEGPTTNDIDQLHGKKSLSSGLFSFDNALGGSGDRISENIIYDTTTSYLKVGFTYLDQFSIDNSIDFALRRYNTSLILTPGNVISLPYPGIDRTNQIISTNDGGMILVGRTDSQYTSYHHVFVAKIGPGDAAPNSTVPHDENPLVSVININTNPLPVLFPNPTNGYLSISNLNNCDEIRILNVYGEVVLEAKSCKNIDVSTLPTGIYFVDLNIDGNKSKLKFIKE